MLWGRDLIHGIVQTTTSRQIIAPGSRPDMLEDIGRWAGPWLALALLGGLLAVVAQRRRSGTVLVLLGASVVGAAQQVRIGETTSLAKHLAFGMVFAAPLMAVSLGWLLRRRRWLGAPATAGTLAALSVVGVHDASLFRTGYAPDHGLQAVLRAALRANPGRPILGEQPSSVRYELRTETSPRQWNDTYSFSFAGQSGPAAFHEAIKDHYFGVIYLSFSTRNADAVISNLGTAQGPGHYYNLTSRVPRIVRGRHIGDWLVWTPQGGAPDQTPRAAEPVSTARWSTTPA